MADSGAKAMGSLYDMLLDFVDTARVHDGNYEIARRLVEHYSQLGPMSLRQMAELCYVSQASLSRFCRFLGFESFAEFKGATDSANYRLGDDYTREFGILVQTDMSQAVEEYRSSLAALLDATLTDENQQVAAGMLQAMRDARRIVFFSHHFLWQIGRYLQEKMLVMGRCVELYRYFDHQLEAARTLGEGDLAIVCSINGSYFSHYHDISRAIFDSGARVAILTQNRNALHINRAEFVLTCGDSNANDIGKYAALMTVDYLVMGYKALMTRE